jgi:hypothetical protein
MNFLSFIACLFVTVSMGSAFSLGSAGALTQVRGSLSAKPMKKPPSQPKDKKAQNAEGAKKPSQGAYAASKLKTVTDAAQTNSHGELPHEVLSFLYQNFWVPHKRYAHLKKKPSKHHSQKMLLEFLSFVSCNNVREVFPKMDENDRFFKNPREKSPLFLRDIPSYAPNKEPEEEIDFPNKKKENILGVSYASNSGERVPGERPKDLLEP